MNKLLMIVTAPIIFLAFWLVCEELVPCNQLVFFSDNHVVAERRGSSSEDSADVSKGNINGVPIAVPKSYQKHAFEYKNESIWSQHGSNNVRTKSYSYQDPVSAFSIYVHWPDMKTKRDAYKDRWSSNNSGKLAWLSISVTDDYARHPRPPVAQQNGLSRMLNGIVRRISERPQIAVIPSVSKQGPAFNQIKVDVEYEFRGMNREINMNWAELVGDETERYHSWNLDLYWDGEMEGVITDLISCNKGKMLRESLQKKCTHEFYLDDWGVYIVVTYSTESLNEWRKIKLSVENLIRSFRTDSGALINQQGAH